MNTLKKATLKLTKLVKQLEKEADERLPVDITLVRYFLFAGTATVIDISLLFILTEFANLYYMLSAGIAYFAGMITNFVLNKFLNFETAEKNYTKQFSKFFVIAIIGLGLNQLIIYFLVETFDLWYMIARLISLFVVFSWSYLGNKYFTFKE